VQIFHILETTVFLGVIPCRDLSRNNRYERMATICGFKSCPQDRGAATVVAIEILLKGFAGARNHLNLEFPWKVAELAPTG
jgi:hypothetical protein